MPCAAETYVFTELANVTGDRMEQYINRELAKRMAPRAPPPHRREQRGRAPPPPGHAPRPDAPRDLSAPRPHATRDLSAPRPHALRNLTAPRPHVPRDLTAPRASRSRHSNQSVQADTRRQSRWHGLFFDVTYHVMQDKMKQLMQNDIYSARERLKALAAISRKHKQSVRFRMGFVFRKLEDLVAELHVLWQYSYRQLPRDAGFRVFVFMAYYQRAMKKYVDLVYVYERVILVYEQYMAAKKVLLASKLQPKYQK